MAQTVLVVALVTFFPMAIGLIEGFAAADRDAGALLRSMGASRLQVFRYVRLPSALPRFFTALRIGITYAVVGAVFAEYVGASVGLGTPGTATAAGLIKNANSTCLNGRPLQRDLEVALQRPVRLANDANCLALSEASDGAGAGAPVVFAAILGTGVGAGTASASPKVMEEEKGPFTIFHIPS